MKAHSPNDTFIVFHVGGADYALPSVYVRQLEMIENITPVPNAPPFVEGVVFSRGQVIPAMSLRARFGLESTAHTARTRLIVTSLNGRVVGLIADSAREFLSIPAGAIQPPPEGLSGLNGNYLTGIATVDGRIILTLDLEELWGISPVTAKTAN